MPAIDVDFETFKALTALRPSEDVSVGDVVKRLLGQPVRSPSEASSKGCWVSGRVKFPIDTKLRHRFRNEKPTIEARIVADGVEVNDKVFNGLSPAAAYGAGHPANGWYFWEVLEPSGEWVKASVYRVRAHALEKLA